MFSTDVDEGKVELPHVITHSCILFQVGSGLSPAKYECRTGLNFKQARQQCLFTSA